MSPLYDELSERAKPFATQAQKADVTIPLPREASEKLAKETGLSVALAEYQLSCVAFCNEILSRDGFVLHASAVKKDGAVYLFSAPSGVGKSTHARLWQKKYGATVINDDKPAIMMKNGKAVAYGTPWCGSGFVRENDKGEVKVLYFLKRAKENRVFDISSDIKAYLLLESMLRPQQSESMDKLLYTVNAFVQSCTIKGIECNTELSAAEIAYINAEGQ